MTFEDKLYNFVEKWRYRGMDYEIIKTFGINPRYVQVFKKQAPSPSERNYANHLAYYTHAVTLINKEGLKYADFKPFKI